MYKAIIKLLFVSRVDVSRSHRGVQASCRDNELSKLSGRVKRAEEIAAEERELRLSAEAQLASERAARLAALAELERNSMRLLELAGASELSLSYPIRYYAAWAQHASIKNIRIDDKFDTNS